MLVHLHKYYFIICVLEKFSERPSDLFKTNLRQFAFGQLRCNERDVAFGASSQWRSKPQTLEGAKKARGQMFDFRRATVLLFGAPVLKTQND